MKKILNKSIKILVILLSILVLLFVLSQLTVKILSRPSNDRQWSQDQAILPYAEIKDNLVTIHNIRNFKYRSTTDYDPSYYDKTFDLEKIKGVYYIVEPFSGIPDSAHTFLSFEFENDNFIAISIEIRKEKGESFHPVKGLYNKYELTYVIGDENDLVKLRSNFRKDKVYIYPIKTTKEKNTALFLDMLERTNSLKTNPEFYNTITNNCTINIARHVNEISPKRVPFFSLRFVLPADSDELAYKLGLIDTELTFEKARERFLINDRALKYSEHIDFSRKIREPESASNN